MVVTGVILVTLLGSGELLGSSSLVLRVQVLNLGLSEDTTRISNGSVIAEGCTHIQVLLVGDR